jgi:hypothetical protein
MKKAVLAFASFTILVLLAIFNSSHANPGGNSLSYQLTPGRLGDHLLAVVKTELAAELELKQSPKNKISVVHVPFEWSDHLALSKQAQHRVPKSTRRLILQKYKPGIISNLKNTTFLCSLKTDIYIDKDNNIDNFNKLYEYTRNNPEFKKRLQRVIAPLHAIEPIVLPEDRISVAVHVRTGGGFDKVDFIEENSRIKKNSDYSGQIHPQRFPPESYYTEQLETISTLLNHQPLFVHIFTDDRDPIAITKRFKQTLSHLPNITYSCRTRGNAHNLNVIDDLFNMTRFNCLIRPASSYSKMAQLLGDHAIITYPKQVIWVNGALVADKVGIINHLTGSTPL